MKKKNIKKCKDLFESILCLCAEGPEFYKDKLILIERISNDAVKGIELCNKEIKKTRPFWV